MADAKLFADQRRELILKEVSTTGFVTVQGMAEMCGVSEMTLRRDLDHLSDQGLVSRIHGGATVPGHRRGAAVDLIEPSVEARVTLNHGAKVAIARRALEMVELDQTIALDVGTTTFELAELLADIRVCLFTNSLKIAGRLSRANPTVYVLGGQVSGTEPSVVGSLAIKSLGDYFFDAAFIGVSGISTEGFFDYSLEDTEIKKVLITRSRKSIVLGDSTKFERMSVAPVARPDEIDILITDKEPPGNLRKVLGDAGVRVEIAPYHPEDQ